MSEAASQEKPTRSEAWLAAERKKAEISWLLENLRNQSRGECRFAQHLLAFDLNEEWRFAYNNLDQVTVIPAWAGEA